jgi:hypothetical protein
MLLNLFINFVYPDFNLIYCVLLNNQMDVTTENRSVEVQGAGGQGLEGNGQSNSDDNVS